MKKHTPSCAISDEWAKTCDCGFEEEAMTSQKVTLPKLEAVREAEPEDAPTCGCTEQRECDECYYHSQELSEELMLMDIS